MNPMKTKIPVPSRLLLMLSCFGFLFSGYSQSSLFSHEQFIGTKGDTLKYRQLFPDANNMRKFPLVIFLHGSGERGNDNEAQLKWGVDNFATDQNMASHPCFVIAPQCPENLGWANFSREGNGTTMILQKTPSKTMALLIDLINDFVKKNNVDANRIYITGMSMGGFGTFDLIARYPNLFAAAVPVCGGGDVSTANAIKNMPIWIFNGAEDPSVDPSFSLNMLEALTKAGAHPGFTQYPEVGHFSWIHAYSDPLMMEWLFRQHK